MEQLDGSFIRSSKCLGNDLSEMITVRKYKNKNNGKERGHKKDQL